MRTLMLYLVLVMLGCNKISFLSGGVIGDRQEPANTPLPVDDDTEKFIPGVAAHSPLDILMVIDNSSSMAKVHQGLANRLDALLGELRENDWQIAITTTDPRDCSRTLSAASPRYEESFKKIIHSLGVSGTLYEQATRMAIAGLQKDCNGKSWLRANSAVAVLIITDEDNFDRGPCGDVDASGITIKTKLDDTACQVAALHTYLQKIRIPGVTAKVYGLIDTNKSKNFLTWKDSQGQPIFAHYDSVHAKDYTATLRKISQHIYAVLQNRFVLRETYPNKVARVFVASNNGEQMLSQDAYNVSGKILTIKTTAIPPGTTSIKVVWLELE